MKGLNRRALVALGAAGASAAGLGRAEAKPLPKSSLPLTPQVTEGPYYLKAVHLRADIAEGLDGVPLDVRFTVLDPAGAPVAGARVDIWHCDALGRYSGFSDKPGEAPDPALANATFLRGAQVSDEAGNVLFHTLYPGWYPGRTAHIHYKVWRGPKTLLTGQLFLPDALSEFLFTQAAAYRREGLRDTFNRTDPIAIAAGELAVGAAAQKGDRYLASLTVVVDPASDPVVERLALPSEGGPGLPPPGPPPAGAPPFGPPPVGGQLLPPPGAFPGRPELSGEARTKALLPGKALI